MICFLCHRTQNECILLTSFAEDKPYWWDVGLQFNIVKGMALNATKAMATAGSAWVVDIKEDPVAIFTNGKQTLVRY